MKYEIAFHWAAWNIQSRKTLVSPAWCERQKPLARIWTRMAETCRKVCIGPALQLTEVLFLIASIWWVWIWRYWWFIPTAGGAVCAVRRNARTSVSGETTQATLGVDYLLGVNEARQGALKAFFGRWRIYLRKDKEIIPPAWLVQQIALGNEIVINDDETTEDLKILALPGSSGWWRRTKTSVRRDKDGHLAIMKFPKKVMDLVVMQSCYAGEKSRYNDSRMALEAIMDKPVLILPRFDRQDGVYCRSCADEHVWAQRMASPHNYAEIAYALTPKLAQIKWFGICGVVIICRGDFQHRRPLKLWVWDRHHKVGVSALKASVRPGLKSKRGCYQPPWFDGSRASLIWRFRSLMIPDQKHGRRNYQRSCHRRSVSSRTVYTWLV